MRENVTTLGFSGTGKTHVVIGLIVAARKKGLTNHIASLYTAVDTCGPIPFSSFRGLFRPGAFRKLSLHPRRLVGARYRYGLLGAA